MTTIRAYKRPVAGSSSLTLSRCCLRASSLLSLDIHRSISQSIHLYSLRYACTRGDPSYSINSSHTSQLQNLSPSLV